MSPVPSATGTPAGARTWTERGTSRTRREDAGARLIHVSTDYVFWGGEDRPEGGYREDDPPGPVRNYYALTKLVAEEAARRAPDAVIVRTSFRESEWPHPAAFDDLFTGQDYVDVIAAEFARLLRHLDEVPPGILHLVTERKSAYELAVRRNPRTSGAPASATRRSTCRTTSR